MNYRPYPRHKDSGVEWLGEVPEGWGVDRLRFHITTNPAKSELNGFAGDDPVSFVPMEAIGEYGGLSLEQVKLFDEVGNGYTYFKDGDVVVAKITPCFENGKGAIAEGLENGVGFGTTELHVLRPSDGMSKRFLFYLTISDAFRKIGESYMYGAGGQKRVPEDFIRDLRHPTPSPSEQRAIAYFLDHKTAEIDALIEKKQKLIELLQEKRTAIISHAVTKGLNPKACMKDSGVAWLGEVPECWKVMRYKHAIEFVTSGSRGWAEYYSTEGSIFLRIGNLTRNSIDLDLSDIQYVDPPQGAEGERTIVKAGDVLVSITAYLGSVAVVPHVIDTAFVSQHIALTRPLKKIANPRWLAYSVLSTVGQTQLTQMGYGGTKIQLSLDDVKEMVFLLPPLKEQEKIVAELDSSIAKIDSVVSKVKDAISRLQEYRSALISAAVTGKIDVRKGESL